MPPSCRSAGSSEAGSFATIVHRVHRNVREHPPNILRCHRNARSVKSQAALTVAALALDTQLHRDPAIGRVLVKVRPGSAPCPGLNIYEQVCRRIC